MKKDFLHITDFTTKEILEIFELTKDLKLKFKKRVDFMPFKNHSLAMIFAKPSARTRISFETGFCRLGGSAVYLGHSDIEIGKRESVKDIARVISCYNDMIMARLFDHNHIIELAKYSSVPVINGLTDYNHPCQIMADIFTILEYRKSLDNLKIVYVGDGNNIVNSWLELSQRLKINFVCACPKEYSPDKKLVKTAKKAGISDIQICNDPIIAVKNADIVYTDVWASMGKKHELDDRIKYFEKFQVNRKMLKVAGKSALFMHCLPAQRGLEVSNLVIESKKSIVFQQAENRMHVQNAIMFKMANIK